MHKLSELVTSTTTQGFLDISANTPVVYYNGLCVGSNFAIITQPAGLPDAVFFQDDKETVVLKKGDKTHVVSNHDDEYDRVYGFLLAYFQMNSGLSKAKANKYLESLRLIPKQEVKK